MFAFRWLGSEAWHFVALCDAHVSSESAHLVLQTLEAEQTSIQNV